MSSQQRWASSVCTEGPSGQTPEQCILRTDWYKLQAHRHVKPTRMGKQCVHNRGLQARRWSNAFQELPGTSCKLTDLSSQQGWAMVLLTLWEISTSGCEGYMLTLFLPRLNTLACATCLAAKAWHI
eukprot:1164284-Lingulodinium_polyedra.AAC.1